MTAEMVPPIKIDRIGHQKPVHPAPQIWPVRLRHQMKMVAHQNKTENRAIKASRRFTEQFEKASAVLFVMENGLPRIAARTKMINRVLKLYPQRPRHAVALPILMSNVKCLDL